MVRTCVHLHVDWRLLKVRNMKAFDWPCLTGLLVYASVSLGRTSSCLCQAAAGLVKLQLFVFGSWCAAGQLCNCALVAGCRVWAMHGACIGRSGWKGRASPCHTSGGVGCLRGGVGEVGRWGGQRSPLPGIWDWDSGRTDCGLWFEGVSGCALPPIGHKCGQASNLHPMTPDTHPQAPDIKIMSQGLSPNPKS